MTITSVATSSQSTFIRKSTTKFVAEMDSRLLFCMVLLIIAISEVSSKVQQKKHYHYQKIYTSPSKPTHAKPAKVATYSKKGFIPVQVPTYEFGYKIHDPHNKNFQEKTEVRLGDAVQGYYSLLQPNGEVRVVRYQSDDSGFHSKVTLHKNKSQ